MSSELSEHQCFGIFPKDQHPSGQHIRNFKIRRLPEKTNVFRWVINHRTGRRQRRIDGVQRKVPCNINMLYCGLVAAVEQLFGSSFGALVLCAPGLF